MQNNVNTNISWYEGQNYQKFEQQKKKLCTKYMASNFLICQPIFIRFSLLCSENVTLSSEIKLDQLRTSPLKKLIKHFVFLHLLTLP